MNGRDPLSAARSSTTAPIVPARRSALTGQPATFARATASPASPSATPSAFRRHVAEPGRRLVRRLADVLDEALQAVADEALRRARDPDRGHAVAGPIE